MGIAPDAERAIDGARESVIGTAPGGGGLGGCGPPIVEPGRDICIGTGIDGGMAPGTRGEFRWGICVPGIPGPCG